MKFDTVEWLAVVAGAMSSLAFAPQAIKLLRAKNAEGVSAATYWMVFFGAAFWMAYGFGRQSPAIIFWNLVALSLSGAVLLLKLRLHKT